MASLFILGTDSTGYLPVSGGLSSRLSGAVNLLCMFPGHLTRLTASQNGIKNYFQTKLILLVADLLYLWDTFLLAGDNYKMCKFILNI